MEVRASAPGKLILLGEHAVVYGHPALVAAVDLRLEVHLATREEGDAVIIRLPQVGGEVATSWAEIGAYTVACRERWQAYAAAPTATAFARMRGDDPVHLPKVALGEAAGFLGEQTGPALTLTVDSRLPIGAGFGSSAALAVAVLAAYLTLRGAALDDRTLERLALDIERRQHGQPSGVDGATVLHGGIVWARPRPAGGLDLEPLVATSPHLPRFRAYDTGTPAETTGAVVAAVRERLEADPERLEATLTAMGDATTAFREELVAGRDDPERAVELLRRFEAGLETLGVVPEPVRQIVRRVEASGGAAKISGAGALTTRGPSLGAGTLLVYHPEPEALQGDALLAGLPRHPLALGAPGYRIEPPATKTR